MTTSTRKTARILLGSAALMITGCGVPPGTLPLGGANLASAALSGGLQAAANPLAANVAANLTPPAANPQAAATSVINTQAVAQPLTSAQAATQALEDSRAVREAPPSAIGTGPR